MAAEIPLQWFGGGSDGSCADEPSESGLPQPDRRSSIQMKKSFIRENPFLFHGNAKVQRIAGPIGDADVQKMLRAGEYSRLSGLVHLKGRSLTAILIKGRDTAVIHAGAGILQSQPDLPVLLGMRRAGGASVSTPETGTVTV